MTPPCVFSEVTQHSLSVCVLSDSIRPRITRDFTYRGSPYPYQTLVGRDEGASMSSSFRPSRPSEIIRIREQRRQAVGGVDALPVADATHAVGHVVRPEELVPGAFARAPLAIGARRAVVGSARPRRVNVPPPLSASTRRHLRQENRSAADNSAQVGHTKARRMYNEQW